MSKPKRILFDGDILFLILRVHEYGNGCGKQLYCGVSGLTEARRFGIKNWARERVY